MPGVGVARSMTPDARCLTPSRLLRGAVGPVRSRVEGKCDVTGLWLACVAVHGCTAPDRAASLLILDLERRV